MNKLCTVDDEVTHSCIGCRSFSHLIILGLTAYDTEKSPNAVYTTSIGIACSPLFTQAAYLVTLSVKHTGKGEVVIVVTICSVIRVWHSAVRTNRLEVGAAHGDVGIHFIVCLTIAYPAVCRFVIN